jgi:hypothetical protein
MVSAFDPLLSPEETARCCATPWTWGEPGAFRAIVTQTADPRFGELDPSWFPELEVVFDGRDSLRDLNLPETVTYRGIGVPSRPAQARSVAAVVAAPRSPAERTPSMPARGGR